MPSYGHGYEMMPEVQTSPEAVGLDMCQSCCSTQASWRGLSEATSATTAGAPAAALLAAAPAHCFQEASMTDTRESKLVV